MRAIWKGAVSFGLVTVPVRLFAATQEHGTRFHHVHRVDGGRIRMHRVCSTCGADVAYDQLAKGYQAPDGRLVVLDDEDFAALPLVTGKEIDVVEFVASEQVDPILFDRTYYLEPEARAATPYALLREALTATDRIALVKVTLRQRESMAVLRVREKVIVMQTLLWPDEIRSPQFDVLDTDIDLRPQDLAMAESLVENLTGDFTPEQFEDRYARAVADLVSAKLAGAEPAPVPDADPGGTDIADLFTALQRSVERARADRNTKAPADTRDSTGTKAPAGRAATGKPATGKRTASEPAAATRATARSTAKNTAKNTARNTARNTAKKASSTAGKSPTTKATTKATKKATAKTTTRRKSA